MLRKITLYSILVSTIVLGGCDYQFNEITPTYAVPLINSNLSIYNLLAKADSTRIRSDQDGLVTVVYNNKLLQIPADQIVSLANQNLTTEAVYTGPTINPFPAGQVVQLSGTVDVNFSSPGVPELYRILFETGVMSISLTSNIKHNLTYILTFEKLNILGQPLNVVGSSQYIGAPHSSVSSVSLAGGEANLNPSGTTFNKFRIKYDVSITGAGGNPLNNGDRLTFGFNLSNMQFQEVDCYLGNTVIPLALDSVELDLFQFTNESQTASGGTFALTDPRISLKFTNSLSLPMNIGIEQLQLKQKPSGIVQDVLLSNFQNPFPILYPQVPGNPVVTNVFINKSNSNLKDLITPTKKVLLFQVDAITNPTGKTINKFTKTGSLDVEVGVELPLTGYGYNWVLGDTVELGLALSEQQNLKSGILRLNLENKFPIDVQLQVYFLDENMQVKDSLFSGTDDFVKSGILDASGRVITATKTTKDIPADNKKMANITASKFVVIRAEVETKDGPLQKDVKIYSDYYIKVKMGIKAEMTYNF